MNAQTDMFDDFLTNEKPEFLPQGTCAGCEYIVAAHFKNRNLYFCTAQKGGRFGKKIKKSNPACAMKVEAKSDTLEVIDGYYGGIYKRIKRG